jgi:hypothetical protein
VRRTADERASLLNACTILSFATPELWIYSRLVHACISACLACVACVERDLGTDWRFRITGRVRKYVTKGSKTGVIDVIGFQCLSLGSSTLQFHDSLGNIRAGAYSEAGFCSQTGDRALGVYYRRAAFCCTFVCVQKDSMQRLFIKKCFLFTMGSVCRVKCFHLGRKRFANEEFETKLQKLLRQQSKVFCAAGFDALVMRWDKCFSDGEGYIEKLMGFFSGSNFTCFTFVCICDLFTDCPSSL